MVDRVTQSPSRIPVPVRSPSHSLTNNKVSVSQPDSDVQPKHIFHENGLVDAHSKTEDPCEKDSGNGKKDKGFETFVMTGDMIIRTTPSQKTRSPDSKSSSSDSNDMPDTTDNDSVGVHTNAVFIEDNGVHDYVPNMLSKAEQRSAESGFEDGGTLEKERDKSNITEPSSASDLSMISSEDLADIAQPSMTLTSVSTPSELRSDTTITHRHTNNDNGVVSPDTQSLTDMNNVCEKEENDDVTKMVTSKSAEKFVVNKGGHLVVRSSKSQELQSGNEFSLVEIDIDENNKAYSLDQIPQQDKTNSTASLERTGDRDVMQTSRSLDSSPEHKVDSKTIDTDREFIPGFISLGEPHIKKVKTKDNQEEDGAMFHERLDGCNNNGFDTKDGASANGNYMHRAERDSLDPSQDLNLLEFQPLTKGVDRPSAQRLAKRLYFMDGFKKSDVSRHLSKKNEFGSLVAEEYLKFFCFENLTLDAALRIFLKQFSLIGETQERERVLAHFSKRYVENVQGIYRSEDACHTLTCAIMLLNTDLHAQAVGRKMTCAEFIENLAELNDGENFPKELLKTIYQAIKAEPIEWAMDDEPVEDNTNPCIDEINHVPTPSVPMLGLGHNPFLDVPDPEKTNEYKSGYVMRKCCMDAHKRRTPVGKRGWKMFYASLRDMILYLYKDQHGMKKGQLVEGSHNVIRVHHCLVLKAVDYSKKQHVFKLQTALGSEYLFQTSDSKELQEWIDTINFVAASLSAPQLPGAVGSQKKFQRPLLPATYTRYNMQQQLTKHEEMSIQVEQDIQEHRMYPPEKGSKARIINDYMEKEAFLESELKRYKTYVYLLQSRMASYQELEPSLVETVIGEDEETDEPVTVTKPVHRSLSDRKSNADTVTTDNTQGQNGLLVYEEYINPDTIITHF